MKENNNDNCCAVVAAVFVHLFAAIWSAGLYFHFALKHGYQLDEFDSGSFLFALTIYFVSVTFVGLLFRIPVFGKNSFKQSSSSSSSSSSSKYDYNCNSIKESETNTFCTRYNCSQAEGRLMAEQQATNQLLQELLEERDRQNKR